MPWAGRLLISCSPGQPTTPPHARWSSNPSWWYAPPAATDRRLPRPPAGRNLRPRAGSDPGAVRLDRGEPLQLCHVVRGEVGEAGGPEQLHGPLDLAGQDFDGPVHALPATGHQAVQVGPADQSEVGAHGDRCHDIGAVHDAGVEDDLRAAAEL